MRLWKKVLFSVVTIVLFFGLVEAALWAVGAPSLWSQRDPFQGFSRAVRVFEPSPDGEWMQTTVRATRHSFNPQRFRKNKPADGYRVFVLGGSSAYGFPWGANLAFARWLGDALKTSYPDKTVEVVNAAGMSYGFHRLRILTNEVLDYEPDALVYYEGHNEFVERKLFRALLEGQPRADRLQALLFRSRLFSLFWRLAERRRPAPDGVRAGAEGKSVGELLGFDVVREEAAETLPAEKLRVAGVLAENLSAILDLAQARGVPVILCTVATNLRDWAPNQSLFGTETPQERRDEALRLLAEGKSQLAAGAAQEAVALLERARDVGPGYADIHFQLGRACEAAGRWDDARRAYIAARDLDTQPVRAIGLFNDTIRRIAGERGVPLVDVDRIFEETAPHGLVGFNLVEDYVHPNREGHRLIALHLWRHFTTTGLPGGTRPADPETFWAAAGGKELKVAATGAPLPAGEAQASTPAELYNLAYVMDKQGEKDRAIALYQQCLALDPRYYAAALNLGILLAEKGQLDVAARAFQQAAAAQPRRVEALNELGVVFWRMNRLPAAEQTLRRAVSIDPKSSRAWNELGMVLGAQKRSGEAVGMFQRAIAINANDFVARANLGMALLAENRPAEAIPVFRGALELKHDFLQAQHGLADSLLLTGAYAEATEVYRGILAANPDDRRARLGLEEVERRRGGRPAPR